MITPAPVGQPRRDRIRIGDFRANFVDRCRQAVETDFGNVIDRQYAYGFGHLNYPFLV